MQSIRILLMLGGLAAVGALPAASQTTPQDVNTNTNTSTEPTHESYLQMARAELQEWRQERDAFNTKALAEGHADSLAASNMLNVAWANTKAEAGKLEVAGANDWEDAKASFEVASHKFVAAYNEARHEPDGSPPK